MQVKFSTCAKEFHKLWFLQRRLKAQSSKKDLRCEKYGVKYQRKTSDKNHIRKCYIIDENNAVFNGVCFELEEAKSMSDTIKDTILDE